MARCDYSFFMLTKLIENLPQLVELRIHFESQRRKFLNLNSDPVRIMLRFF
ncbi:hypothetical protein J22TS1_01410 [Siminovitchia terrae]|nr:hypothetical protein J22TS1_01410 [Siminovitchia terrae]